MTYLWHDEHGQDVIEYTLLVAFVAVAVAAMLLSMGGNMGGVMTGANTTLATANTNAS
jgi:Flp pilus assembly pilin Flp